MPPSLPQELIERIIRYHGRDLKVLQTLSVVSSSFLFPARHHIFYAVNLRHPQGASDSEYSLNYTSFLPFIIQGGPSICLAIRDLVLGPGLLDIRRWYQQCFTAFEIVELIQLLPRLRRLQLVNVRIIPDELLFQTPLLSTHTLDKLHIRKCDIRDGMWLPLLQIIGYFHSITHLELCSLMVHSSPGRLGQQRYEEIVGQCAAYQTQMTTERRTAITKLTFMDNVDKTTELVNGMLEIIDVGRLDVLDIGHEGYIKESYVSLIRHVTPQPKRLVVRVNEKYRQWRQSQRTILDDHSFDLSSCTSLQSLELQFALRVPATDFQTAAFNALATLPPASSHSSEEPDSEREPALTALTIRILQIMVSYPVGNEPTNFDAALTEVARHEGWFTLANLLGRLPKLRSVTVVFVKEDPYDDNNDWTIPASVREPIEAALSGPYQLEIKHAPYMTSGESRLEYSHTTLLTGYQ